jgi:hypothetical protein
MKLFTALCILVGAQYVQAGAITQIVKGVDKAGHAVAHAVTPPAVKPVVGPITGGVDKSGHVVAHGLNKAVKFVGKVIW